MAKSHEAMPRAKTSPWQVPGNKAGEESGVLLWRSRSKLHIRGSSQLLQGKMSNHGMSTMPSRRAGTIAARIVVEMEHAEKLHTVEWPEYVYLRQWSFDQKTNIA